jgi:hypothetical protein
MIISFRATFLFAGGHDLPCRSNNGICSHFCFPSANDTLFRKCTCPAGLDLHFGSKCSDNTKRLISSYPRSFLAHTWPVSDCVNSNGSMETGKPLSVSSPAVVESMDSTVYKGYSFIVYASSTTHTVERVSLDGRFQVTLASGLPKPHGVAVDQKNAERLLFRCCIGLH